MSKLSSIDQQILVQICTEFVNDSDTIIGMQCDWHDYLTQEISVALGEQEIKELLHTKDNIISVEVEHNQYGNMEVYAGIADNRIVVSTKKWLLK
jgi:urate oxidase